MDDFYGNQQNKKTFPKNWHIQKITSRTEKNKQKNPLVSDSLTYTKNSKSLIMQCITKHGKKTEMSPTNFLMLAETARETIPYTDRHMYTQMRQRERRGTCP